jgi:hypothetical protein
VPEKYTTPHRVDSWNWAQRFLAWHTPRERETEVTIGSDLRSGLLPDDFLGVYGILDRGTNAWMGKQPRPVGGGVHYEEDSQSNYWVWGSTLMFGQDFTATSTDALLYYWAYWPEIEYELTDAVAETYTVVSDEIIVPPWAILPLCHLTAATLLQPGALEAARARQWNIMVDSGTPVHNVRAQQAREHLWWWNQLMGQVVPRDWRVG